MHEKFSEFKFRPDTTIDSTLEACKKLFGAQFIESRKHKQILMNLLLKHSQSLLSNKSIKKQ